MVVRVVKVYGGRTMTQGGMHDTMDVGEDQTPGSIHKAVPLLPPEAVSLEETQLPSGQ